MISNDEGSDGNARHYEYPSRREILAGAATASIAMAPAIANAVFHATGKPVCHLPIQIEDMLQPPTAISARRTQWPTLFRPRKIAPRLSPICVAHVAVRTPSLAEAKDFYVGKLDFRVVAEWDFADEKLAYLAPPTDDLFYVEVLGDGDTLPTEARPYRTLAMA